MEKILEEINKSAIKLLVPLTTEETYKIIVEEAKKIIGGDYGSILLAENGTLQRVYTNAEFLREVKPRKAGNAFQTFITNELHVLNSDTIEMTSRILVRFDSVLARMEHLIFSNAYTKVATTLLMCAKRLGEENGDEIIVKVPLTHKDIATMIGITRETTSLEMKKLERKGYITRNGKYLIIKNYKLLEEEALQSSPQEIQLLPTSI